MRLRTLIFSILALCFVTIGGFLAALFFGWQPALDWLDRRLGAAMRKSGVEVQQLGLEDVSVNNARVGPLNIRLPGLVIAARSAKAYYGPSIFLKQNLDRLDIRSAQITLDLQQLGALAAHLKSSESDAAKTLPEIDVDAFTITILDGERRYEITGSGNLSFAGGFFCKLSLSGGLVSGEVRGEYVAERGNGEVQIEGLRANLGAFAAIADAFRGLAAGNAQLIGLLEHAEKFRQAELSALTARAVFERPKDGFPRGQFGALGLTISNPENLIRFGDLKIESRSGELFIASESVRGIVKEFRFDLGRSAARVSGIADGKIAVAADVRLEKFEGAGADVGGSDWKIAWSENRLTATSADVPVAQPVVLRAKNFSAAYSGGESPQATLAAECLLAPQRFSTAQGNITIGPQDWTAQMRVVAALKKGEEALRVEFEMPSQPRVLIFSSGSNFAGAMAARGVLTLDRALASGSVDIFLDGFSAQTSGLSLRGEWAQIALRLPRTWHAPIREWRESSAARLLRDLVWTVDGNVSLAGLSGRVGDVGLSDAKISAVWRGVDVTEDAGVRIELAAGLFVLGSDEMRDVSAEFLVGLERGVAEVTASVPSLRLRPSATVTGNLDGTGEFSLKLRVPETHFDAQADFPDVFSRWPEVQANALVSVEAVGVISAGSWRGDAMVNLREGVFAHAVKPLRAEGGAATLAITGDSAGAFSVKGPVSFATIFAGASTLKSVDLNAAFAESEKLTISDLKFDAFGGKFSLVEPVIADLQAMSFAGRLRVERVQLGELLGLFPDVPARANAFLSGQVGLGWATGKIQLGEGALDLVPGELGIVQFTRPIRALTQGRDPEGFLTPALRDIETAITELSFDRLHIALNPPDNPGQSLRVRFQGMPTSAKVQTPVTFDVNVNAPLETLLDWGMRPGLKF